MQLTLETFADAAARGFKPFWHKVEGFSKACFDMNEYRDIRDCMTGPADKIDCATWGIGDDAWRKAQKEAIELAMAIYEDEN